MRAARRKHIVPITRRRRRSDRERFAVMISRRAARDGTIAQSRNDDDTSRPACRPRRRYPRDRRNTTAEMAAHRAWACDRTPIDAVPQHACTVRVIGSRGLRPGRSISSRGRVLPS